MNSSYRDQIQKCSVTILLRAVVDAEGNQCKAAENLGVHRNLLYRILHEAGWNNDKLKRLAEEHNPVLRAKVVTNKMPVQSEMFADSGYWKSA